MNNTARVFTSSEDIPNNNVEKLSLVQKLLAEREPSKTPLDPVDASFETYTQGLENQTAQMLEKMHNEALEATGIPNTRHLDLINAVLIEKLQDQVSGNVVLTLEQRETLSELS